MKQNNQINKRKWETISQKRIDMTKKERMILKEKKEKVEQTGKKSK